MLLNNNVGGVGVILLNGFFSMLVAGIILIMGFEAIIPMVIALMLTVIFLTFSFLFLILFTAQESS